ncbi:MAG TPA: DUF177 domain-containing protein [Caldimonas sp.]|jgi:uncharacterized protein|nr:DUF177 domain-containing protein [Caldimonas sp.]HEX2542285.1 DUF177 domain-containing protein [Caldimonas sp.]
MSVARPPDPRKLDVARLAATGAEIEGEWPLEGFARLVHAMPPGDAAPTAPVSFRATGERAALAGAGVQAAVRLDARALVRLECQRCLQAMAVPLHVERRFFFVPGEDEAAALDEDSEDDVLALIPSFDLHGLVEDELLLALPIVPRHDVCPVPVSLVFEDDGTEAEPGDHPFAALASLKAGKPP